MKVIIAGSRGFNDYELLKKFCDYIIGEPNEDVEIVSGKAKGADTLGERYAIEKGFDIKEFPADWSAGKSAGYLRNGQMADYADMLIAFHDGESKGTKHMIDLANEKELNVVVYKY
jgi:hypothetical protein